MSNAKKKEAAKVVVAPVVKSKRKIVDSTTNRAALAMKYAQARTSRQKLLSDIAAD